MQPHLLTWNPDRWTWSDFGAAVRQVGQAGSFEIAWSTGNTRNIQIGDPLFLLRQSQDRGIIGSGVAASQVYEGPHWDSERNEPAHFVRASFDRLVRPTDRLPLETLAQQIPEFHWNNVIASGGSLPNFVVDRLAPMWQQHLASLRPPTIPFSVGELYTRQDIYRILQVPEEKQHGDWDTGYHRHGDDWFIFANVGAAGRTGHDYDNHWEGEDLVWRGKTRSRIGMPTVSSLLNPPGFVFVFTRDMDRQPFRFAGVADPVAHEATIPVTIRWRFGSTTTSAQVVFPDEVPEDQTFREGAVRTVQINAYERNSAAREACLRYHGTACVVCGFDFETAYGEIGRGFIHVHHLREIASIGEEYVIDPIADLRPVCPNCHSMLHTQTPAMEIDDLKALVRTPRR